MRTNNLIFDIPLSVVVRVPVQESNVECAVAQAKGKVEFLLEMLDELKAIENKQPSSWDREEVISKIVGHYDDLWVDEIQEIKNEKVEMD